MTECARCGDCCDPVILPFHPTERATARLADPDADLSDKNREDYNFMIAHWRPIRAVTETDAEGDLIAYYEVRCDMFDKEKRLCGAHESRPPICRNFPWYGRAEDDVEGRAPVAESLSPRCSFNADVPGRTFLPIVEVRSG